MGGPGLLIRPAGASSRGEGGGLDEPPGGA